MTRTLIAALAVAFAAAPVVASTVDLNDASLSVSQKAQIHNVLNSDESSDTQRRLIEAIVSDLDAGDATGAQVFFITESDESSNTQERLIDAIVN
ncbi:hypothetical protein [Oceanibium sediminis]|uniref:hypothetical protein n=1 Tax=Oceanibium sediminis TaxID=2026339 RepID=UPI000DD4CA9D|nr:hypothetical protein [Oceanibium sediminis]